MKFIWKKIITCETLGPKLSVWKEEIRTTTKFIRMNLLFELFYLLKVLYLKYICGVSATFHQTQDSEN